MSSSPEKRRRNTHVAACVSCTVSPAAAAWPSLADVPARAVHREAAASAPATRRVTDGESRTSCDDCRTAAATQALPGHPVHRPRPVDPVRGDCLDRMSGANDRTRSAATSTVWSMRSETQRPLSPSRGGPSAVTVHDARGGGPRRRCSTTAAPRHVVAEPIDERGRRPPRQPAPAGPVAGPATTTAGTNRSRRHRRTPPFPPCSCPVSKQTVNRSICWLQRDLASRRSVSAGGRPLGRRAGGRGDGGTRACPAGARICRSLAGSMPFAWLVIRATGRATCWADAAAVRTRRQVSATVYAQRPVPRPSPACGAVSRRQPGTSRPGQAAVQAGERPGLTSCSSSSSSAAQVRSASPPPSHLGAVRGEPPLVEAAGGGGSRRTFPACRARRRRAGTVPRSRASTRFGSGHQVAQRQHLAHTVHADRPRPADRAAFARLRAEDRGRPAPMMKPSPKAWS